MQSYDAVCAELERLDSTIARGVFGADLPVTSVDDGPVTPILGTPVPDSAIDPR